MNTNIEAYIGLLIQVPLVGIFVWFSLTLIRYFLAYLEKSDATWQAFLEEQRQSCHDAISGMVARFGDEIRAVGKEVAEQRGKLSK